MGLQWVGGRFLVDVESGVGLQWGGGRVGGGCGIESGGVKRGRFLFLFVRIRHTILTDRFLFVSITGREEQGAATMPTDVARPLERCVCLSVCPIYLSFLSCFYLSYRSGRLLPLVALFGSSNECLLMWQGATGAVRDFSFSCLSRCCIRLIQVNACMCVHVKKGKGENGASSVWPFSPQPTLTRTYINSNKQTKTAAATGAPCPRGRKNGGWPSTFSAWGSLVNECALLGCLTLA